LVSEQEPMTRQLEIKEHSTMVAVFVRAIG